MSVDPRQPTLHAHPHRQPPTRRAPSRRSLGQNFLTDDSILADIVAASRISQGDLVLEVGPGTGNLTRHLVATGARITAVEKDDTLFEKLQVQFAQVGGPGGGGPSSTR